jgi:TolB-like protein/DNA-binding winged helix-turn-helix (wHTH) protein/Flp pilus assembly protein TadD
VPQSAPTSRRVHFAEFEADLRAGELYRSGHKVKLQERPFQVLAVLLERAGEVVTRDELRQRIWPADTFVDYGHGLAVAINKLREALRDSPEQPRFVETVGRRGYRFVAEVETNGVEVREPSAGGPLPGTVAPLEEVLVTPPRRKTRALQMAATAGTAVLIITLLGLGRFLKRAHNSVGPPHVSSLAVLPMKNLSNDPGQEYFVEGMTDEITTDVAKLSGLRVISRTSAMRYRDSHKSLPEIAQELNVDGVVEGTVERLGDRVRIRTQLIYAPADQHLWAEVYEGDLKDVLGLEANVANDIASHIELTLASQPTRPSNQRAVNPDAHELYLKGRYVWNKRDPQDLHLSVQYFQQAISKDPGYALAYAGLADAYGLLGEMAEAKAAAEKALELDSELAEAHASLGLIDPFLGWNWKDSKAHFEKAIALNPNYATAHHWFGEVYLMPMGRVEDALAEIRKAQALDPLSAVIATDLGKDLYFARHYDDAVVELQHALDLDPSFTSAHNWLSDTYLEKGMFPEAIAELEKTKQFRDERTYLRQTAYLEARMGQRTKAEQALQQSLQLSQGKPVSSGAVALVCAALGDDDKAFYWLEKAYEQKSSFMTTLRYWSAFDHLRSDARFEDLIGRVGLRE